MKLIIKPEQDPSGKITKYRFLYSNLHETEV